MPLHALWMAATIGSIADLHPLLAVVQAGLAARIAASLTAVSVFPELQPASATTIAKDAQPLMTKWYLVIVRPPRCVVAHTVDRVVVVLTA